MLVCNFGKTIRLIKIFKPRCIYFNVPYSIPIDSMKSELSKLDYSCINAANFNASALVSMVERLFNSGTSKLAVFGAPIEDYRIESIFKCEFLSAWIWVNSPKAYSKFVKFDGNNMQNTEFEVDYKEAMNGGNPNKFIKKAFNFYSKSISETQGLLCILS